MISVSVVRQKTITDLEEKTNRYIQRNKNSSFPRINRTVELSAGLHPPNSSFNPALIIEICRRLC
jgi:hypothetical protein